MAQWGGPFTVTAFDFEDFDVPQGSLEEALLINSPESATEDIFLSKYTFEGAMSGTMDELTAKLEEEEVLEEPEWDPVVVLAKLEGLESLEQDRPLDELVEAEVAIIASNRAKEANEEQKASLQRIDQYGFFVEEGAEVMMSPAGKQKNKDILKPSKLVQVLNQWDTLSEDKRRKIKQRAKRGVPNELRGNFWMKLANVAAIKEESVKKFQAMKEKESPFDNQIHRDLNRSLPKHVFFQDSGGAGQQALFDVLRAYALADTTVGYCQGMGFITAVLLLYASSEDAFCLLQRIIQDYEMAGLFQPGFPTLYQCFFTHKQLLQLWLPRLSAHFTKQGVDPNMYAFGWYTTIYVNSLRFPYIIRILDMFFCDGFKVLYRIAIAILKLMQKALLNAEFDVIVMMLNIEPHPPHHGAALLQARVHLHRVLLPRRRP